MQQGNDWPKRQARSDFENYTDGNINFALEFICADDATAQFILGKIVAHLPGTKTGMGKRKMVQPVREVGDLLANVPRQQLRDRLRDFAKGGFLAHRSP